MGRFALRLLLLALIASPALAAAPDLRLNQRLEAAMGTYVISQLDRSVQLYKTLPPAGQPRKPVVDRGEAVKVHEDVYVDRRLMPGSGAASDEKALRVFPRDAR